MAIADGTIVAYRLTSEYLEERSGEKTYKYSNCFVLIEPEYKTPKGQEFTFYSHYNHLAPWNDLTTWMPENGRYPHFVVKPGYKIKKDGVKVYKKAEKTSVNLLSKALTNRQNVVASPVTGKKDRRLEKDPALHQTHILISAGLTLVFFLFLVFHLWSVGNLGPKSDSVLCSDFCSMHGYTGSSMPPAISGDRTCSCYDGSGNEVLQIPLDHLDPEFGQ